MGLQVSFGICPEIPQTDHIQRTASRHRQDTARTMWTKGNWNRRSTMLSGSRAYVGENTAEIQCFGNHGIPEGEKFADHLRQTRKSEVQIWKQTFLVQRIICRYSRKKYQKDTRIHSASIARRYCQWSDKPIWISRPVYGWACEERQIKHRSRGCPRKRCGWQIFEHASAAGNIPL